MLMWIVIILITLFATLSMLVYLVSRFMKFQFVSKLAAGRKKVQILISLSIIIFTSLFLGFTMNYVNAAVIILHLGIFWLIFDFAAKLLMIFTGKKNRQQRYYTGIFVILFTVFYLGCGWYLAHHVWEKHYTIETEKAVGNLRVVQFADSHIGATFHGEGFAENMKRIQDTNPDVVVITGDFVDDDSSKEDMIASCAALGTLKTTYGVYYSFGNHDKGYYGNEHRGYSGQELLAELEKNGVHVLEDESVLINEDYYLIGRQDRSEEQRGSSRASMQKLMQGLDPEKYTIVLDHQPHDYEKQEEAKVDLVLSGHTHGGQFFPIGYVGEWIGENDRTYGLEKRTSTNFIVTSGISDWALKFKTGCKSEFVVIDIEKKK